MTPSPSVSADPHADSFSGLNPAHKCRVFWHEGDLKALRGWWWDDHPARLETQAHGPFTTSRHALLDAIRRNNGSNPGV